MPPSIVGIDYVILRHRAITSENCVAAPCRTSSTGCIVALPLQQLLDAPMPHSWAGCVSGTKRWQRQMHGPHSPQHC